MKYETAVKILETRAEMYNRNLDWLIFSIEENTIDLLTRKNKIKKVIRAYEVYKNKAEEVA